MDRFAVESSDLKGMGYDELSEVLEVRFHDGRVYQYHPVPMEVWERFLAAPSKGRFFNAEVRRRFRAVRVG
jgi:hypothetical protein